MAQLATIAAFGFEPFQPRKQLKLYQRLGCRTCQFYRNIADPPDPADARKLAEDLGIPFDSVHGVFGPEVDISSPDDHRRRAAVQTYRDEADLAVELGGPMVVVHPAPRADHATATSERMRALRVDPLRHSMEELAKIGHAVGVTFLIENLSDDYYLGNDPAQLARMVRDLESPHVRMCFDTGHANMTCRAGVGDRPSGPAGALEACADVVAYLHVNDNDGLADSHMIPGQGTVPWDQLVEPIRRLEAGLPAMLELFESEPSLTSQIESGLGTRLEKWLSR